MYPLRETENALHPEVLPTTISFYAKHHLQILCYHACTYIVDSSSYEALAPSSPLVNHEFSWISQDDSISTQDPHSTWIR